MLAGPRGEQTACALAQLLGRRDHLPAAEMLLRVSRAPALEVVEV
jgi:hypothetical protein